MEFSSAILIETMKECSSTNTNLNTNANTNTNLNTNANSKVISNTNTNMYSNTNTNTNMNMNMNIIVIENANELRKLKNSELDFRIKSLARQERELLTQVLHVIKEIDNRRLYLEMGYSSLFAYLSESVGYSPASAQRRIDAARLLNEIPSLSEKIESGEIHLTQACMIQMAAREIKRTRQINVSTDDKIDLLSSLSGKNQRDTEKQVAQYFDMPVMQKTIEKTQADDSVRLEITLTKSQYDKLKQAQALVSHAVPINQITDFIEYVSDKVIKQKTGTKNKTIFGASSAAVVACKDLRNSKTEINLTTLVDSTHQTNSMPNIPKGFSSKIKKEILSRHSSCQYRDPKTHKLCGSNWFLQVDHKHSLWAGGNNQLENANVLCSRHNNLKYRREAHLK